MGAIKGTPPTVPILCPASLCCSGSGPSLSPASQSWRTVEAPCSEVLQVSRLCCSFWSLPLCQSHSTPSLCIIPKIIPSRASEVSWKLLFFFFFKFFFVCLFVFLLFEMHPLYLFIYGCVGSSFLCEGFLQLWQAGATLHRVARASHYRGLSCCGTQASDAQAQ